VLKNGLYYSQPSEPEAVPLDNYLLVGSADKNILRVLALRDSLFVLKEDGVFRVWGTDPTNFQVNLLDNTAILIAPESAVVLNNQIYALTTQGAVTISETGVSIISRAIESSLTSLTTIVQSSTLTTPAFGVAYESMRAYWLFLPTTSSDTTPTQYYRYNYITGAWTHGALSKTCGIVNPVDDRLYLGNALLSIIDVERKNLLYSDYADYYSSKTITSVKSTTVSMTGADTVTVGGILYQSPTIFGEIVAVNAVSGTVTTSLPVSFSPGSVDVLNPINVSIIWSPITFSNPGYSKHVREISLLFKSDFSYLALVSFSSDIYPSTLYESVSGSPVGGWGLFAWGGLAETPLGVKWGGNNQRRPIRVFVPQQHHRASILNVGFSQNYAYAPFQLQGLSVIGYGLGERIGQ
jgi:hypothetical protein